MRPFTGLLPLGVLCFLFSLTTGAPIALTTDWSLGPDHWNGSINPVIPPESRLNRRGLLDPVRRNRGVLSDWKLFQEFESRLARPRSIPDIPENNPKGKVVRNGQILELQYAVHDGCVEFSGTVRVDRYKLLGSGSSGDVYKGQMIPETKDGDVAVKIVTGSHRRRGIETAGLQYRVANAKTPATNVAPMLAYFVDEQQESGYMIMRRYSWSLPELFKRTPNPKKETSFGDIENVSEGLKEIHDEGIAHRDIKPANIMLDRGGKLVIIDFDKATDKEYDDDYIVGTPAYLAPELLWKQRPHRYSTKKVDMFSLGIVCLWDFYNPQMIQKDNWQKVSRYVIDPVGSYWPSKTGESKTIWEKVKEKHKGTQDPKDWTDLSADTVGRILDTVMNVNPSRGLLALPEEIELWSHLLCGSTERDDIDAWLQRLREAKPKILAARKLQVAEC